MRIANSAVRMTGSHEYESHVSEQRTTLTLNVNDKAAKEAFAPLRGRVDSYQASIAASAQSEEHVWIGRERTAAQSFQASEQRAEVTQSRADALNGNLSKDALRAPDAAPQSPCAVRDAKTEFEDLKMSVLKKMLEVLHGAKGKDSLKLGEMSRGRVLDLRSSAYRAADVRARLFSVSAEAAPQAGTTSAGTLWRRVTETSVTRSEREAAAFQSQGFAVTEDGRALQFDVSFSMSRSLTQSYETFREEQAVMTDPLIINLGDNPTSVSDFKFSFDLDGDGKKESVSFAGEGSGFLALDVNGNGVIDDGSELFGTKSGDGFADLAAHDSDGNGWIDENDAVYDKLRVWTRDADGAERLMSLREADVGAIYLDSANTEFALKGADGAETNGVMRKTGVYLKESGGAGTLSHVDLLC